MKKTYLLFSIIVISVSLISFSSGISKRSAGAPGDTDSCGQGGCHAAGNYDPSISILLLDSDSTEVTDYIAGNEYTISVNITSPNTVPPLGYGFQLVCLDDMEAAVNNYGELPQAVRSFVDGDREYVVQAARLPVGVIEIPWTAPEVGAVTFYAGGAAVNGNGNPQMDGATEGSSTFSRNTSSSNTLRDDLFTVYPNPTADFIIVESDEEIETEILSITGQTLDIQTGKKIDLSEYPAGVLVVKATDEKGQSQSSLIYKK